MAGNSKDEGRSVAGKVIAIMCAFRQKRQLSNAQIARLTGLPVSTTHRLLNELVGGGMLMRTPDGQYKVGPSLHAIAANGSGARSDAATTDGSSSPPGRGGVVAGPSGLVLS